MIPIIIGNCFSFLAMITDSVASSRKTVKGVLWVQSLGQVFYAASVIFLKGYSAAVQNAMSILRNLVALKGKSSKILEWILVILGVVLGVVFNNLGLIGWLPILANLEYSLAVFRFKDNERALKAAFLLNVVLFCIFNVMIMNYVGVLSNIVLFITTAIFLIKDIRRIKDDKE